MILKKCHLDYPQNQEKPPLPHIIVGKKNVVNKV